MGRDSNDTCCLKLIADIRERRSGVPARLRDLGLLVNEALLPAGDYAVGKGCLVERKAVGDLHRSICSGRLWRQIGALRRSSKSPCLLVEGATIYDGPVGHAAIRGTLLAIADLGVLVIRSESPEETAHWIHQLLARRTSPRYRNRVPYAFRYARDSKIDPAEQALAAAPGISTIVADSIRRF